MNNLKYLRLRLDISLRKLDEYTHVSYATIARLEKDYRSFRQEHINSLCDFFKVNSDFLLGKSDVGIIVELKNSFAILSKSDYEKYLEKDMLKEYVQDNSVWRSPNNELEKILDQDNESAIKKELLSEINNLSDEKLIKILKIIKEGII